MIAIKLDAGNDRNGNRRRVFVVLDKDGEIRGIVDEGYKGTSALRDAFPKVKNYPPVFATTPQEYRELLKLKIQSK